MNFRVKPNKRSVDLASFITSLEINHSTSNQYLGRLCILTVSSS